MKVSLKFVTCLIKFLLCIKKCSSAELSSTAVCVGAVHVEIGAALNLCHQFVGSLICFLECKKILSLQIPVLKASAILPEHTTS